MSPLPTAATMETVKRAANLFRRGLSLKRRIDTRVAAYGSVEDVSLSKNPTFSQESRATATGSSGGGGGHSQVSLLQAGQLPPPRTRKLSRSRVVSPSTQPDLHTASSVVQPLLPLPRPQPTGISQAPASQALPTFRTLLSAEPSPLDAKPHPPRSSVPDLSRLSPDRPLPRRPPPVAGLIRPRRIETNSQPASEWPAARLPETEPVRQRRRSNSFRQGVQSAVSIRECFRGEGNQHSRERGPDCLLCFQSSHSISVAHAASLEGGRTGEKFPSVDRGRGCLTASVVQRVLLPVERAHES